MSKKNKTEAPARGAKRVRALSTSPLKRSLKSTKATAPRAKRTPTAKVISKPTFAWGALKPLLKARARTDAAFRARLLANPAAAFQEALGYALPKNLKLRAVEETAKEIYIVVPRTVKNLSEIDIEVVEMSMGFPPTEGEDCPGSTNPPN